MARAQFDDFSKKKRPVSEPVNECPPCPQNGCKLHGTSFCQKRCKLRKEEG